MVCSAEDSASAMNGSAPASAMTAANPAWSLTRVIGPCATGSRVPSASAIAEPGVITASDRPATSLIALRIARTAFAVVP